MKTVYFDSTILSYLFDERAELFYLISRTKDWWQEQRSKFDCYISPETVRELGVGAYPRKEQILAEAATIKLLMPNSKIEKIAKVYVENYLMPQDEGGDALHLAYASYYEFDYLLSWNFSHLVNVNKRLHIRRINAKLGLTTPGIISPLELFETGE